MIKIRGGRALDELAGPNKGEIRLLSKAKEKNIAKGNKTVRDTEQKGWS
jgi:hypothetical protein